MKTRHEPEVPASLLENQTWRDHFELAPAEPEPPAPRSELDTIQPGHTRGIALLLAAMAACCALLIYGIARGF